MILSFPFALKLKVAGINNQFYKYLLKAAKDGCYAQGKIASYILNLFSNNLENSLIAIAINFSE